jgi:hypothetical protein
LKALIPRAKAPVCEAVSSESAEREKNILAAAFLSIQAFLLAIVLQTEIL